MPRRPATAYRPAPRLAAALTLALLATACTQTAGGGGGAEIVPAGRTSVVAFSSVLDVRRCQNARLPDTRIVQPANGTAAVEPGSGTLSGTSNVRTRKCGGTVARGLRVLYTPNPGFTGADRFTVRYSYGVGSGRRRTDSQTYRVIVQ